MKTEPEPDSLSPEEKLLRVIRGEEKSAAAPAAPTMPPVVRPKLKKQAAPVRLAPAPAPVAADLAPAPALMSPEPSVPAAKKSAAKPLVAPVATAVSVPGDTKPISIRSAAPTAMTPAPVPGTRPKLKPETVIPGLADKKRVLPKPALAKTESEKQGAAGSSDSPPPAAPPASDPNAPSSKPVARRSRLGVASRLLALAALIFLLLSAWEIWGAYQSADPRAPSVWRAPDDEPVAPFVADTPPLPDLDSILALYRQRPLLGAPPAEEAVKDSVVRPPPPRADWEQYLRDHLKLLGFSRLDGPDGGMEALVSDAKTGRMHYLRVGSPLLAEGRQLTVAAIEKDKIVLTDGERNIPVR